MKCPNCKAENFVQTEYECEEVDICKSCHGIWLDAGEITEIVENRVTEFSKEDIQETIKNAFMGIPSVEKETEKICPKCSNPMNPVNYAVDSGIIIDKCPHGHGIWFDDGELEKMQHYRDHYNDKVWNDQKKLTNMVKDIKAKDPEEGLSLLMKISLKAFDVIEHLRKLKK